jgi:hypothetical protein
MCSHLYKIINVVDLLFKRLEIEQLKCSSVDIRKHIHDSTHPNLNLWNQVSYLLEIHLTYIQTIINDNNNSIISIDTMISKSRIRSKLS